MTIRERFERYTTEEIKAGIQKLESELKESSERMEAFKRERNLEFFKAEKEANEDIYNKLMDAEAALIGRA